MSGTNGSMTFLTKLLLALCLGAGCISSLRAESLEVHTVLASEPGKPGAIPADLAKFKAALSACPFSKFANGGTQTVTLSAAAPRAVVQVGAFSLELTRQAAAKIDVTVKETVKKDVVKTVFGPITYTFAKEKTKQLELPTAKGSSIVFLTIE